MSSTTAVNTSSSANSWPRHLSCTSTDAFEAMCSGSDDDEGSDDECRSSSPPNTTLQWAHHRAVMERQHRGGHGCGGAEQTAARRAAAQTTARAGSDALSLAQHHSRESGVPAAVQHSYAHSSQRQLLQARSRPQQTTQTITFVV